VIAKKTTEPINSMTSLIHKLNTRSGFVTVEAVDDMLSGKADSPELSALVKTFRTMVNIVQASNSHLSSGQYEAALSSLNTALQLFEQMGHQVSDRRFLYVYHKRTLHSHQCPREPYTNALLWCVRVTSMVSESATTTSRSRTWRRR
jgi:hypothetical protein